MKFSPITLAAIAAIALTGCAPKANFSGDIQDEAPVIEAGTPASAGVTSQKEPSFSDDTSSGDRVSGGLLDERLIFFAFNQYVVAPENLPTIGAHSDYLIGNSSARVILEGHADERGSNEYNLALGQRRADAVRDLMLDSGVQRSQIETLSFGEEDPRNTGENEEAWAENRRVEIRYHTE